MTDRAYVHVDPATGAADPDDLGTGADGSGDNVLHDDGTWQAESGGSGAPTTADYLVGTANGGLSAEIVVGTSPGGELGGTWASPTVDSTHSGTTHTGAAAAAVSTHEGLSDPHTGYRLESADHSHASTGAQAGKIAQAASHESPDTDSATTALHHTLGSGANQAAAGDHSHGGGASTNILIDIATPIIRTAGSITLNSTTWVEVAAATGGPGTGGLDLDLTGCAAGDIAEFSVGAYLNSAATYAYFTVATIVSGSVVNYFGGRTGGTTGDGVSAWVAITGREETKGGSVYYVVASGDLSAGALKLRLYYRTSSGTNRTLFGVAADPLYLAAKVYRP